MAAPRRYPRAADDAIWAGLIAGQEHATIRAALEAGVPELGLGPCPMPERTYFDHVRALKRDRGIPIAPLDHSRPEAELAESIRRRLLDAAHLAVARLERSVARDELTASMVSAFGRLSRDLEEVERRARARAANASSPNTADRARAESPGGSTRPLSARLAELAQENGPD